MKNALIRFVVVGWWLCANDSINAQNAAPPAGFGPNPFNTSPQAPSTYDRYGNPPSASAPSRAGAVAPPPGAIERAQSAAADVSGTLRRNIESGFEQTSEQLSRSGSQILDSTRSVSDGFSDQLRDLTNSTARQMELTGSNFQNATEQTIGVATGSVRQFGETLSATGSPPPSGFDTNRTAQASGTAPLSAPGTGRVAPPPGATAASAWSSAGAAPPLATGNDPGFGLPSEATRPPGAATPARDWTILDKNVAAPPLPTPSFAPPETSAASSGSTSAAPPLSGAPFGPVIPSLPASERPTIHSPLVDPAAGGGSAASSNTMLPNWASDWGSTPAGGAATNDPFNLPPVVGGPGSSPAVRPTGPPNFVAGQDRVGGTVTSGANSAGGGWPILQPPPLPAMSATTGPVQPPATGAGNNTGSIAGRPAASGVELTNNANTSTTAAPAKEQPWMPLVLSSLALIGSVSANFFLGWSYMDARQKYRTLVQKTADKFRRAAEAA